MSSQRSRKKACACLPNRRQVLGMMASTSLLPLIEDPLKALITGMADGLISKAQAAENPSAPPPRNYIYVGIAGAPARWFFDLPFFPYSATTPGMIANSNVNTNFNAAGVPEYRRIAITKGGETLYMPYLWASTIPTAAGGEVPMGNLLENMLMIRGIHSPIDGHAGNHYLQLQPQTGGPSLGGLVADASTKPIPAVRVDSEFWSAYKSPRGIGQVNLYGFPIFSNPTAPPPTNPLGQLLSPFNKTSDNLPASYLSRRQAMDLSIRRVLDTAALYAKSNVPGASALYSLRGKAETLIRDGIGNVASEYSTLYAKYRSLITRCAQGVNPGAGRLSPMLGITDRPVAPSSDPFANSFYNHVEVVTAVNPDLRTLLQDSSTPIALAESMAVAEYLIKNGYSSSVTCGLNLFVMGMNCMVAANRAPLTAEMNRLSLDSHGNGAYVDLILSSFVWRSVAACLNELITQLKAANLWNETVIQLSTEFGRKPREVAVGSDHGIESGSVSVFSGAINKPFVVGDTQIAADPSLTLYQGTWGYGAENDVGGGKARLTQGYAASTIAHLLRVKTPTPNNLTLLQELANGGVQLTYLGKAKEV